MPRTARIVGPGLPHHVILRGNNRRRLFSYPLECRRLLALIAVAARQFGCAVHAYCVMTNHLHLVLTPHSAEALAKFVQRFAQRYAQMRNRARGGSGKLFEQRFSSKPIKSDGQLAANIVYVELNPVKAGMVRAPAEYRWSSYRAHAGLPDPYTPRDLLTPSTWYLSLGSDAATRQRTYAELVAAIVRDIEPAAEPTKKQRRLLRPDGSSAE